MVKLFNILFLLETGPSAQSVYPGLNRSDPRVSRTKDAAEESGFLNMADQFNLNDEDIDDEPTFPNERDILAKTNPKAT